MRSTPAFAAPSKTRREPATFSSRVASLAVRIANARCTTTSAPFTRSRTLAASVTSPCRYRLFFQPRSAGSKGRRAIPSIRLTDRERSSALTMPMPRSPVGPVTATVRPSLAMGAVLPDDEGPRESSGGAEQALASGDEVEAVGLHEESVGALAAEHQVLARACVDHVALVAAVDAVVAGAAHHEIHTVAARHLVVAGAGLQIVVRGLPGDAIVASLAVDLVGVQCAEELVGCLGADQGVGHRDGSQQG